MKRISTSKGLGLISFLSISAFLVIALLIGFQIAPAYIEHYSVSSTLNSLQAKLDERADNSVVDAAAIKKVIDRMFDVNSVRSVTSQDTKVTPEGANFLVQVTYNVNIDLVGNISLLLHFDNSVVIKQNAT